MINTTPKTSYRGILGSLFFSAFRSIEILFNGNDFLFVFTIYHETLLAVNHTEIIIFYFVTPLNKH